jgi:SAM-dependent methyltransferase
MQRIGAKMTQWLGQSDRPNLAPTDGTSDVRQQYPSSPLREKFTRQAQVENSILEIGPFFSPCVKGDNVSYFDVLDTAGLIKRAQARGRDVSGIPHIDFVSESGDLSVVDRKFNAVISAHCIEHQTDLIRHLQQVRNVLLPGGKYYLIVPDKRFCFDHFIPETTLDEVIDAQGRTRHPLMKVIEHRALTTHNNPIRHWNGDHFDPNYSDSILRRTKAAIEEFEAANGNYIDVHSWQFTPKVLTELIRRLQSQRLIAMFVVSINETPRNRFEFTAVLEAV